MERDIRDLFKNDDKQAHTLPEFHRKEFIQKLEKSTNKKPKVKMVLVYKIAATILLLFSGTYFYNNYAEYQEKKAFKFQIQEIENEYLSSIDKEWTSFKEVTKDTVLIYKYEQKLQEYSVNYTIISQSFKENPNNIIVLESLIENLQRRLQLIKDIKNHLEELNQKNKTNETIYI